MRVIPVQLNALAALSMPAPRSIFLPMAVLRRVIWSGCEASTNTKPDDFLRIEARESHDVRTAERMAYHDKGRVLSSCGQ